MTYLGNTGGTYDVYNPDAPPIVIQDSSQGITSPEQFTIDSVMLILNDGTTFELKPSILELSLYEDLFSPTASGYVLITDSSGFIQNLNISGFNFIQVQFNKTGSSDPSAYKRFFRVYKIGERYQSSRQNESIPIYFCSEERIISDQIKVAKSYPLKRIDEVIKQILTESMGVNTKKINQIEQTLGQYSFIVPNLKPFEAISWLSTYAQPQSTQFVGADMLLYEDRYGYNFRSLQSLMSDNVYRTFNYSPQNVKGTKINFDFNAILAYRYKQTFNSLENKIGRAHV